MASPEAQHAIPLESGGGEDRRDDRTGGQVGPWPAWMARVAMSVLTNLALYSADMILGSFRDRSVFEGRTGCDWLVRMLVLILLIASYGVRPQLPHQRELR